MGTYPFTDLAIERAKTVLGRRIVNKQVHIYVREGEEMVARPWEWNLRLVSKEKYFLYCLYADKNWDKSVVYTYLFLKMIAENIGQNIFRVAHEDLCLMGYRMNYNTYKKHLKELAYRGLMASEATVITVSVIQKRLFEITIVDEPNAEAFASLIPSGIKEEMWNTPIHIPWTYIFSPYAQERFENQGQKYSWTKQYNTLHFLAEILRRHALTKKHEYEFSGRYFIDVMGYKEKEIFRSWDHVHTILFMVNPATYEARRKIKAEKRGGYLISFTTKNRDKNNKTPTAVAKQVKVVKINRAFEENIIDSFSSIVSDVNEYSNVNDDALFGASGDRIQEIRRTLSNEGLRLMSARLALAHFINCHELKHRTGRRTFVEDNSPDEAGKVDKELRRLAEITLLGRDKDLEKESKSLVYDFLTEIKERGFLHLSPQAHAVFNFHPERPDMPEGYYEESITEIEEALEARRFEVVNNLIAINNHLKGVVSLEKLPHPLLAEPSRDLLTKAKKRFKGYEKNPTRADGHRKSNDEKYDDSLRENNYLPYGVGGLFGPDVPESKLALNKIARKRNKNKFDEFEIELLQEIKSYEIRDVHKIRDPKELRKRVLSYFDNYDPKKNKSKK